jgi:transglutaminase-like putative cysteine protease
VIGRHTIGGMTTQLRASPDMSIEERLATIQDLVHQSVQDPRIRKLALQITSKCPERDGKCEAEAVYQAIKKRVRYTGDIGPIKLGRNGPVEGIDLFQSAYRTWEFGGGDCDDHAILASALLAANGLEPQLRVTAESRGGDWGHIYALAGLPKEEPSKWVALDTTLPGNKRFGYEVPFAKKVDFPA